jgi:hypothetical protein
MLRIQHLGQSLSFGRLREEELKELKKEAKIRDEVAGTMRCVKVPILNGSGGYIIG